MRLGFNLKASPKSFKGDWYWCIVIVLSAEARFGEERVIVEDTKGPQIFTMTLDGNSWVIEYILRYGNQP
jgi:hypothetical protein